MKVYKSKLGLRFCIAPFQAPLKKCPETLEDIVTFSEAEWDWIKSQNLKPEEFKVLWSLKKDDFRYNPIPSEQKTGPEWAKLIINQLKGRNDSSNKEDIEIEKHGEMGSGSDGTRGD